MIQNDFLMRLIENLGAAFANLVSGKSGDSGGELVEETRPEQVQKKASVAREVESLLSKALNANPLFLFAHLDAILESCDPRLAFQVSRLLELHGDHGTSSDRSYQYASKFASLACNSVENRGESIELLRRMRRNAELDPAVLDQLFNAEVSKGEFARAEDVLFEALEAGNTPNRIQLAFQFYEDLCSQSDEALAAGNFSRQEIEEGRSNINTFEGNT